MNCVAETTLVNLTTHSRGQTYQFYRMCIPEQRSDYSSLKAQLMRRFTPVRIWAVHSNLFHQRKQVEGESVDAYAQDLRKLFYKAYPRACQGNEQAEDLEHSVLAYQFVAGLNSSLKIKVAGVEGTFDELLVKAQFEEAKIHDLAIALVTNRAPRMQTRPGSQAPEHSRGITRVPVDPAFSKKRRKN